MRTLASTMPRGNSHSKTRLTPGRLATRKPIGTDSRLQLVAAGIHQHQALHPLRRQRRHAPGHLAAQRVAADRKALHPQLVEQLEHEARELVAAVAPSA